MHLALLFALLSVCFAKSDPTWEQYKSEYGKVYSGEEEEATRYTIWLENFKEMERHNSEYSSTYTQGINQFTDMTHDEFVKTMCGGCLKIPERILNGEVDTDAEEFVPPPASNLQLPDTVIWEQHGYVTHVKNQGSCGSCYSFSATGALEGAWFKKTGKLVSLSEQQIVDCSGRYGNGGCHGGWYQDSWRYIRDCGGSNTESYYPYKGKKGWICWYSGWFVGAKVRGYVNLRQGDEDQLKQVVATVGPVSVAISVGGGFGSYRHGVYYNPSCRNDLWGLNHAVLVVGYGTENGQDYWLVKNSWGSRFGAYGYIKMARNRGNNCGIATKPSYPTV